jgi:hypothetical protein
MAGPVGREVDHDPIFLIPHREVGGQPRRAREVDPSKKPKVAAGNCDPQYAQVRGDETWARETAVDDMRPAAWPALGLHDRWIAGAQVCL